MAFLNLLLALLIGAASFFSGLDPWLAFVIGWFAFRVEVAMTNHMAGLNMLQCLVAAENARMQSALEAHRENVTNIARNN